MDFENAFSLIIAVCDNLPLHPTATPKVDPRDDPPLAKQRAAQGVPASNPIPYVSPPGDRQWGKCNGMSSDHHRAT